MRVQIMPLKCQKCEAVFDGEIIVGAPVKLCLASMGVIRCPKCGGEKNQLLLRPKKERVRAEA